MLEPPRCPFYTRTVFPSLLKRQLNYAKQPMRLTSLMIGELSDGFVGLRPPMFLETGPT
jgi:hypothetical protein